MGLDHAYADSHEDGSRGHFLHVRDLFRSKLKDQNLTFPVSFRRKPGCNFAKHMVHLVIQGPREEVPNSAARIFKVHSPRRCCLDNKKM